MKKIILTLLLIISLTGYSQYDPNGYYKVDGLPFMKIGKTTTKFLDTLLACNCIPHYTTRYRLHSIPEEVWDNEIDTTALDEWGCDESYPGHFTKHAKIIALDTTYMRIFTDSDTLFKFDYMEMTFLDDTLAQIFVPMTDSTLRWLGFLHDYPVTKYYYTKSTRVPGRYDYHIDTKWSNGDISAVAEIQDIVMDDGTVVREKSDICIFSARMMMEICERDNKILQRKLNRRKFYRKLMLK